MFFVLAALLVGQVAVSHRSENGGAFELLVLTLDSVDDRISPRELRATGVLMENAWVFVVQATITETFGTTNGLTEIECSGDGIPRMRLSDLEAETRETAWVLQQRDPPGPEWWNGGVVQCRARRGSYDDDGAIRVDLWNVRLSG